MLDQEFEDRLKAAAGDYNAPPATPRDRMWAAIQARRAAEGKEAAITEAERAGSERGIVPFRPYRSFRSFRLAAGIAAVLALGIGLGRLSIDRPTTVEWESPASEIPRLSTAAYQLTTTEHLSQSEAFLTLFRASLSKRGNEQLASATARHLLATNRLLLDSPAATDARMKLLLQDLELVLAEIAQLSPQLRSRDLDMIKEGLEQGGVLSRLRTAVPSGSSTTQGAL
jgi:hypothetical protein